MLLTRVLCTGSYAEDTVARDEEERRRKKLSPYTVEEDRRGWSFTSVAFPTNSLR
jgi:hypothetical protein